MLINANDIATPPQVGSPSTLLWIVGVGGTILLGGLVAAVVLSAPAQVPARRNRRVA